MLWRSSRRVLRINISWTSLGRLIKTFPGPHFRTSQDVGSGLSRDVRLGRPLNGQIGSLGDVLGALEGDVLGTSRGPIFDGWAQVCPRRKNPVRWKRINTHTHTQHTPCITPLSFIYYFHYLYANYRYLLLSITNNFAITSSHYNTHITM